MSSQSAAELLPGVADEIAEARSATVWHNPDTFFNSPRFTERYMFISSFCEIKRHKTPKQGKISSSRRNSKFQGQSQNKGNVSKEKTLSKPEPLPKKDPIKIVDPASGETWFLRCSCDVEAEDGYMLICCDRCGFWQHGICFNYNSHTLPEKYVCAFCENKPIRCKCGNNHDYRVSIIRCSKCGYYVHRRCEGLNYGPLPDGNFVCYFCGKSNYKNFKPAQPQIPSNVVVTNKSYMFTQEKLNALNSRYISGPFNKTLYNKFVGNELSAREFSERIYSKFNSFFFLCHQLYASSVSKKKRNRLLNSFLSSLYYMCYNFYGISKDKCIEIFDSLIYADLYQTHIFEDGEQNEASEFTENARIELANMNNIIKFSIIPRAPPIRNIKNMGLIAMTDMGPDQFITIVDGFIGDIEEFPYDPKVDSAYYLINGTRFVLDTTRVPSSPLHSMKRSIFGNCALKLVQIGDAVFCGLFVTRNYITYLEPNESFNGVKSGAILTLGIDFMPAIIKDNTKWINWHCIDDEEAPTIQSSIRVTKVTERERPKSKKKARENKTDDARKRRNRKVKRKVEPSGEITLFNLFESEEPGELMCKLIDEESCDSEYASDNASTDGSAQPTRSISWNEMNEKSFLQDIHTIHSSNRNNPVEVMNHLLQEHSQ